MGFNYYAVLGITRSACDYDIKMAFRKKAIQYNPARNNDNFQFKPMFTLICEAYEVLSDRFRKAVYDQYGGDALKKGVVTPLGFVPPYMYDGDTQRTFQNFFGTDSPFADILNSYRAPKKENTPLDSRGAEKSVDFNQLTQRMDTKETGNGPKETIELVILSLEEIYLGCVKLFSVPIQEVDPCSDQFNIISSSKTLHVKIKPGLPEHTVFRFPREPREFAPMSPEVLVVTKDKPHDVFWREGVDLHMNQTVALKDALTGCSFTVKTLDDRILHVPITDIAGCSNNGSTKIIKSEGMPLVEEPHKRGNLIIHLLVDFPKSLTEDLRKTLRTLLDEDWVKNTTRQILDKKLKSKFGNLDF